jgi:threonine synthase
MKALGLRCVNCGREYNLDLHYQCEACSFPLEVVYASPPRDELLESPSEPGIWRWQASLPEVGVENRISLGEGSTPLVHAARLSERTGIPQLYIKNEGQNPTGSFKDRPTAMGVSVARSFGIDTVVVSSTGNAGASLAAYAARAGLRALVFVTDRTPAAKLVQMALHGAQIVTVRGSLSDAYWLARNAAIEWGWMDLTSTFLCPYTVEGDKTVAYELFTQLGAVPEWIVIPVSVGPLLVGIFRGFQELVFRGLADRLPRMVAAQALGCAPIARAFAQKAEAVYAWEGSSATIAGGIADPLDGYEQDGTYTLRVVRQSGGLATASSDDEILQATRLLARTEGIFSEPTGAVSLAALQPLSKSERFSADQRIVCVTTGHGLKQVRSFEGEMKLPEPIDPSLPALERFLDVRTGGTLIWTKKGEIEWNGST